MKESVINKSIQDWLVSQGAYVIKTIVTNRNGVPDIIACLNGHFLSVEGKTLQGRVSELQVLHAQNICRAGGLAIVTSSLDKVKEVVSGWVNSGYKPLMVITTGINIRRFNV